MSDWAPQRSKAWQPGWKLWQPERPPLRLAVNFQSQSRYFREHDPSKAPIEIIIVKDNDPAIVAR